MKLAFLHLSDIHLRDSDNQVATRADKIAAALASADPLIDACVVAITGDIAFSGKRAEYDRAREFFRILRDHLHSRYGDKNIAFFLVPGNHDCDFSNDGDLRSVVLSKLPETVDHLDPDSDIVACSPFKQSFSILQPNSQVFPIARSHGFFKNMLSLWAK